MSLAHEHVERILAREEARNARLGALRAELEGEVMTLAGPKVLLAEGDSWFDYPGTDVLNELEGLGYEVHSVAHRGDTLESMAYGEKQLDGLSRKLSKMADRDKRPDAILLSGGGNDIAGEEFHFLLDHARSATPGLNTEIVQGMIDRRLRSAYETLIEKITLLHEAHFGDAPARYILHGYARPVPDGRGFWGGWGPLPGPRLEPGFHERGFLDLPLNTGVMGDLIDHFNDMLRDLAATSTAPLVYVDVRGALRNDLTNQVYREDSDNELHPEEARFAAVARLIHAAI